MTNLIMGQFRFLGTSQTNRYSIHEEIKKRVNQGMLATTRRRIFCLPVCCPKEGLCSIELDTMEILCVFKNKAIARVGTAARFADLYAGQLARSQFTTGRAHDRPFRSRFFHIFPRSCGKCWVATQAVLYTACISCSPPHINFRISA